MLAQKEFFFPHPELVANISCERRPRVCGALSFIGPGISASVFPLDLVITSTALSVPTPAGDRRASSASGRPTPGADAALPVDQLSCPLCLWTL